MILETGLIPGPWRRLWISLMSLKMPGKQAFRSKIENSYPFFMTLA